MAYRTIWGKSADEFDERLNDFCDSIIDSSYILDVKFSVQNTVLRYSKLYDGSKEEDYYHPLFSALVEYNPKA